MKNICVFIETLLSGGAEKQAILLAKALKDDHNIFLVVWKGHYTEAKLIKVAENNRIKVIILKGNIFVRFSKLVSFLRKEKINIIFSFLASNNFYGSIAGKLSKVDFIIGGIRNAEIPYFKFIIQRFLHNHVMNFTIFNNYSGKDNLIAKGFKKGTCVVIPNCFELDIPLQVKEDKKTINIISLARFVAQKDYPTAIRSINYLANELLIGSDLAVHYFIVGYGVLEEKIRSMIKEYNLENIITVVINPKNIPEYLTNADIYLSTSLFEGTSNSLLEAMSFSIPIVATNGGDNALLVDDGKSGYICTIGDHKQIAEKMFTLVTNADKRKKFSIASYNKLKSNYTMKIFKDNYLEFIKSLISGKN